MTKREMVINYVPGEECRVAVIENGVLEEFHSERADSVSHVGNIYLGTVVNVEPAIQAAFVDFGLEQSGFLHVSDLHPRYFPGEDSETTEMVGKKTPRRERPPIQQCLRRGQEIAVQVLKEGVGTKGPTLTSYLSIPGRFLVMMPLMDRVGVSRKVEDEETRRKMREILDQLELPEGFGFILRTAGLERTKAELKRDLAYLLRLWKDMERRWTQGSRPKLLYSESDLLVRALRDMLSGEIDRIIVDNEAALKRAARFLKIVAPRSAANLVRYVGKTPVFHSTGVEPQIRNIHSREVPLPSGGRLVIDETEALVAIDVNSGKSREARDAETNAYETNLEAVDEICRQLRLRDLGGIVVNDLIDMRSAKHRREVENRMKENLKKDRARTTVTAISEFGILEMTRQRMRGSQESQHFADCPVCRGRGLVQKPDSVADDSIRELATMLEAPRVHRVEMVVGPRLAGELLSTKRHTLSRLERVSGKHVDVRVSESIPVDRVSFYAYDDRGSDIDIAKIPTPKIADEDLRPWEEVVKAGEDWAVDVDAEARAMAAEEAAEEPEAETRDEEADFLATEYDDLEHISKPADVIGSPQGKKKRRRRRGRGGRGEESESGGAQGQRGGRHGEHRHERGGDDTGAGAQEAQSDTEATAPAPMPQDDGGSEGSQGHGTEGEDPQQQGEGGGRRRRRRRRRRGRGGRGGEGGGADGANGQASDQEQGFRDAGHADDVERAADTDTGVPDSGAAEDHGEHGSGTDETVGGEAGPGGGEGEGGQGGGRRRRRRRRRRGRGGQGGEGAHGGGPQESQHRDRGGHQGGGGGGAGGGGGGSGGGHQRPQGRPPQQQNREPRRAEAPQPPPAPSSPAAAPKAAPRTLYAFRRKLSPSERARIKPE